MRYVSYRGTQWFRLSWSIMAPGEAVGLVTLVGPLVGARTSPPDCCLLTERNADQPAHLVLVCGLIVGRGSAPAENPKLRFGAWRISPAGPLI
jgi:hypothetical protein